MTSHLIFGRGNLGLSLRDELLKNPDNQVVNYGREQIAKPNFTDLKLADFVWWCCGGNHTNARQAEETAHFTNVVVPLVVFDQIPASTRICFFSTADCVNPSYPDNPHERNTEPARSKFAHIKGELEGIIRSRQRPYTAIVRLSSLYGTHRPLDTYPGRILSTEWPPYPMIIPSNEVIPTPTDWVAQVLVNSMHDGGGGLFDGLHARFHHLAPWGSVSMLQWTKMIFESKRDNRPRMPFIERICWDSKRPRYTALGCSLPVTVDHWSILWQKHFQREAYQVR